MFFIAFGLLAFNVNDHIIRDKDHPQPDKMINNNVDSTNYNVTGTGETVNSPMPVPDRSHSDPALQPYPPNVNPR
jgi:hypothetical protein